MCGLLFLGSHTCPRLSSNAPASCRFFFGAQRQRVHIKEASERRRPNIPVVLQFDSPVFLPSPRSAPPRLICLSGGEWHRGFFVLFFNGCRTHPAQSGWDVLSGDALGLNLHAFDFFFLNKHTNVAQMPFSAGEGMI